jgi:hypothetical protein
MSSQRVLAALFTPAFRREPFGPSKRPYDRVSPGCFRPFRAGVPLKRIGLTLLLRPLLTSDMRSSLLAERSALVVAQGNSSKAHVRPPRVSLTTFATRPPDLQHEPSMDGGLRRVMAARPTRAASIRFLYVRPLPCSTLPSDAASPRSPLRYANPSPPSSWIRDLHPPVVKHAWHT